MNQIVNAPYGRNFRLYFYRRPEAGEIGPQQETLDARLTSKTAAIRQGKQYAQNNQWRFLEARDIGVEP